MSKTAAEQQEWCFCWFPDQSASPGLFKAALLRSAKWQSRDKITVSFLDGDSKLQERVEKVAHTWTGREMANLRLVFQNDNDSMIRISFRKKGSWSAIGTTCMQRKNLAEPTMNFGWLNADSTDEKVQRVVLHEFGHALGLIHEHQSPVRPIDWNRDAVMRDLMSGDSPWSASDIEENLFRAFQRKDTNYTAFDDQSIMLYSIPETWTNDNYTVEASNHLSDTDRAFVRKQYP